MKKNPETLSRFKTVVLTALMAAGLCAAVQAAPAEIYLVRHAEKLKTADQDPALSTCGRAQAKAMAKLIQQPLTKIYHSGYQRTQQTAELIAATQVAAKLVAYPAKELPQLAQKLLSLSAPVLIVGHSNTTAELFQLLGSDQVPSIGEQEYGVLYKLSYKNEGYVLQSSVIQSPELCNTIKPAT